MNQIKVQLDSQSSTSYKIHVGSDIIDRIGVLLSKGSWTNRHIIVTDSQVNALHGKRVLDTLNQMGLKIDLIDFPAGEASKNIQTSLRLVEKLMVLGADRHTALIALGGGVTGDMTGFIASIFMRGLPFFQIPTTLLAQVDSSIGGKTGIDIPAGKNLLGTFYQPQAVFIDLSFLQTLPDLEFNNGLSEILKHGIIPVLGFIVNVIMVLAIFIIGIQSGGATAEATYMALALGGAWLAVSLAYFVISSRQRGKHIVPPISALKGTAGGD